MTPIAKVLIVFLALMIAFSPTPLEGAEVPKKEQFKLNARLIRKQLAYIARMIDKFGDSNVFASGSYYQLYGRLRAMIGGTSIKGQVHARIRKNKVKRFLMLCVRNLHWRFGSWDLFTTYLFKTRRSWYRQIAIGLILGVVLHYIGIPDMMIGVVGATYYVDWTNGNDTNDGLAAETGGGHGPWKTVAKVNAMSPSAGDIIGFKRGETWTDATDDCFSWSGKDGASGNVITITNYGTGALPIFDGNNVAGPAFYLTNCDYITVDGIHVTNNGSSTLFFIYGGAGDTASCNYIIVKNCTLTDPANSAILLTKVLYGDVENCTIEGTGIVFYGGGDESHRCSHCTAYLNTIDAATGNDGITVHQDDGGDPPGSDFEISYNVSSNATEQCIVMQAGDDVRVHHNLLYDGANSLSDTATTASGGTGCTNIVVHHNFCSRTATTTDFAILIRANGPIYYNNVVYIDSDGGRGVQIYDDEINQNIGNIKWEHNTIVQLRPNSWAFRISNTNGYVQDNLTIRNNIFVAYQGDVFDCLPDFSTSTIDYNCYYSTSTTTAFKHNGTSYTSAANLYSATGFEQHGVFANPVFVDIAGGTSGFPDDLALQVTSPCIAGGVGIVTITTDYDDENRDAATPDIGAYEYYSSSPPPPSTTTWCLTDIRIYDMDMVG